MKTIDLVREFHDAFNVACARHPDLSNPAINSLRFDLLKEELSELRDAMVRGDKVGALDALTDLQYVLDGAYLALGFSHVKDEAFAEVHRSNMSKLGSGGTPVFRQDGKILKGPYFTPPDLQSLVL